MINDIERRVLEMIGENPDSPDVFADTEAGMEPIRKAISDAISEIIMVTGSRKRQYQFPLREGQPIYRIVISGGSIGWITNAFSIVNARRLEQTDLHAMIAHDPRWMQSSGTPWRYFPIGNDVVGFYPRPTGEEVIELTIVEIPDGYTRGEDRILLREAFKYAAVHFAVSQYWATRGDATEAASHFQSYMKAIGMEKDYLPFVNQQRTFKTEKSA